jgi:hypothetical protein
MKKNQYNIKKWNDVFDKLTLKTDDQYRTILNRMYGSMQMKDYLQADLTPEAWREQLEEYIKNVI